jgi:hypothetical protein
LSLVAAELAVQAALLRAERTVARISVRIGAVRGAALHADPAGQGEAGQPDHRGVRVEGVVGRQ